MATGPVAAASPPHDAAASAGSVPASLQQRRHIARQQQQQQPRQQAASASPHGGVMDSSLSFTPLLPRRAHSHTHIHTVPSAAAVVPAAPKPHGPVSFPTAAGPGLPDETVAGPLHAASRKALALKAAAAPGDLSGVLQLDINNLPPAEGVAGWTQHRAPASAYAGTIRKKSGEVVKPSLKWRPTSAYPPPRCARSESFDGRYSCPALPDGWTKSMPASPVVKAVHFNQDLEQVKVFRHRSRPSAVSASNSPENTETETETETEGSVAYPYFAMLSSNRLPGRSHANHNSGDPLRHDGGRALANKLRSLAVPAAWSDGLVLRLPNFPSSAQISTDRPVFLERVELSDDLRSIKGTAQVRNISFEKWVAVRFTTDNWATVNEVGATYHETIKNGRADRFTFSIRLNELLDWPAGQTRTDTKTMLLCLRYMSSGQEFWDNNQGQNYQLDFRKRPPQGSAAGPSTPPQRVPAAERAALASARAQSLWLNPAPAQRPSAILSRPSGVTAALRGNSSPSMWGARYDLGDALRTSRTSSPDPTATDYFSHDVVASSRLTARSPPLGSPDLSPTSTQEAVARPSALTASRLANATPVTSTTSSPDIEAPVGKLSAPPGSIPTSFNSVRSWGSRHTSFSDSLPPVAWTRQNSVPMVESDLSSPTSKYLPSALSSSGLLPGETMRPRYVTDSISVTDPIPSPIPTSASTLAGTTSLATDDLGSPLSTPMLSGESSEGETPSPGPGPASPTHSSILSLTSLDSAYTSPLSSRDSSPCDVGSSLLRVPWAASDDPLELDLHRLHLAKDLSSQRDRSVVRAGSPDSMTTVAATPTRSSDPDDRELAAPTPRARPADFAAPAPPVLSASISTALDDASDSNVSESASSSTTRTTTPTPHPATATTLASTGALSLRDLVERFCWASDPVETSRSGNTTPLSFPVLASSPALATTAAAIASSSGVAGPTCSSVSEPL